MTGARFSGHGEPFLSTEFLSQQNNNSRASTMRTLVNMFFFLFLPLLFVKAEIFPVPEGPLTVKMSPITEFVSMIASTKDWTIVSTDYSNAKLFLVDPVSFQVTNKLNLGSCHSEYVN